MCGVRWIAHHMHMIVLHESAKLHVRHMTTVVVEQENMGFAIFGYS